MDYLIVGIGVVLIVLTFLIHQKVSKKRDLETDYKETLGNIFKQLGAIEKVQEDFKDIQDNIIDFRNLFNNKTERGKLGEEYLEDIIKDALQAKHYKFQYTLGSGKRVDCFLNFGTPQESICIDSKFSWENYKKMAEEKDEQTRKVLAKAFADDINKHIKDISEKYIVPGETAPLALMFVASEGVFRAIENSPQNFVVKAREKDVVIVSPTTMWSFLRTYRLLIQNREMYEQSSIVQKEVGELYKDVSRLAERITNIDNRHSQISEDFRQVRISMEKVQKRALRIQNLDLEQKKGIENIETIKKVAGNKK